MNENIEIKTSENSTITVLTEIDDLTINGGGKSLNISTLNLGNIDVSNNSGITLSTKAKKHQISF